MKVQIRLGKIAGVEVDIHYSWFLVFVLVSWSLATGFLPDRYPGWTNIAYWVTGIIAVILLFASVLVHELAHSIVAKARGLPVSGITLFILGGVSNLKTDAQKASDEFVISIVGPGTSFLLAAFFWLLNLLLGEGDSQVNAIVFYMSIMNALLGAFNLIPAFPLDGGRVLRSAIWAFTGNHQKATRISTVGGQIVGIGMVVLGAIQAIGGNFIGGIWLVFLGWFLQGAAGRNRSEASFDASIVGVKVKDVMDADPPTIDPAATIQEAVFAQLLQFGIRALPVCDGEMVVGILSLADVKRLSQDLWPSRIVRSEMTTMPLITVGPEQDLSEALTLLTDNEIHQLLVIEEGKLVGILSKTHVKEYMTSVNELGIRKG